MSAAATVVAVVVLIVIGLVVGALGRLLHPGPDPIGIALTALIGMVSLLIAGLLLPAAIGWFGYIVAILIAAALVTLVSHWHSRRAR